MPETAVRAKADFRDRSTFPLILYLYSFICGLLNVWARARSKGKYKMLQGLLQGFRGQSGGNDTIDHDDLVALVESNGATVVDVREPREYASGAIAGSINVPLSGFDPNSVPKGKPVVVYCMSGARSGMAQGILRKAGFEDVRNYRPGIGMWRMQGGRMR